MKQGHKTYDEELLDDVYEQEYLYLFPSTCVHHNKIIILSQHLTTFCVCN